MSLPERYVCRILLVTAASVLTLSSCTDRQYDLPTELEPPGSEEQVLALPCQECDLIVDTRPLRASLPHGDSASALTDLGEFVIRGTAGGRVMLTLSADDGVLTAVGSEVRVYVDVAGSRHAFSLRDLQRGVTAYAFTERRTVRIRYAMNRRIRAQPTGAARLTQSVDGAAVIEARTPWVRAQAGSSLAAAAAVAAQTSSCPVPGPGTHCGVTVSITPFVTGGVFGGFQSNPGTGVSSTIAITFSQAVSSVTVTALDPDFAGNRMEAFNAAGETVASAAFAGDGTPGVFTTSTRTVSGSGIVRVLLIPAPAEFVAYDNLSFVPQEGCRLTVTRLSQGDTLWADVPYDGIEGKDISNLGCTLASVSMALNFAGIETDPGTLNEFMIENGLYDEGDVHWDVISARSGGTIKYNAVNANSVQELGETICSVGSPVILKVKYTEGCTKPSGVCSHFVLATGFENGRITIADPGFADREFLDDSAYNNEFDPRGFAADPPDLSSLWVNIAEAELLVTDGSGRRTGIDPATGAQIEEIPQSQTFVDEIDDDVTGGLGTKSNSFVFISQPPEGTYTIEVTGLAQDIHTLSIRPRSQDGTAQPVIRIPVSLDVGATSSFEVEFSSSPGAVSRLVVGIDIKPGSDPNSMDPDDLDAVITVAILTDQSFDATTVDQTTVRFGKMGTEAVKVHSNAHEQDVDKDGDTDLVFHFRLGDTGLSCGDTEAKLTGETSAGTPIEGKDAIRTVGC